MRFVNKTAIVTGGSKGIGRQICLSLAEEGVKLIIADINPEEIETTSRLVMERSGRNSLCVETDLRYPEQIEHLATTALRSGDIDFLINNSGVAGPTANLEDVSLADWEDTMRINLTGMFLLCKHLVPHLKTRGDARIVNMASAAPKVPLPWRAPYCASKMAVIGLTRSMAKELGPFGIRVNALCPGAVEGERQNMVIDNIAKQTGQPRESVVATKIERIPLRMFIPEASVADMVVFLCSEQGSMLTGQDINITGGSIMW